MEPSARHDRPARDMQRENAMLHALVRTVCSDARHNHEVMQRFQQRQMALLNAADLHDLLHQLTLGMQRSFDLDRVHLMLLDPYQVLRDLLGAQPDRHPPRQVELCHDLDDFRARIGAQRTVWLGAWSPDWHRPLIRAALSGSVAVLPLVQADGVSGCLCMQSRDPTRFQAGLETDFIGNLAHIAAVCLENAVNRERLRLVGFTDSLTGLYNRRHLEHRLAQELARAQRHAQPLACLFIDADHFKTINDAFGHAAGDRVLEALARRLTGRLRASDIATRYGGEEFAVLLPHTDIDSACHLAENIRQAIAGEPVPLGNGELVPVTVSIGVAAYCPQRPPWPGCAGQHLLAHADRAVYQAKQDGRNRVSVAATA
jgi:diguanylate cyclase (GGDEF)-like protein